MTSCERFLLHEFSAGYCFQKGFVLATTYYLAEDSPATVAPGYNSLTFSHYALRCRQNQLGADRDY